MKFGDFLDWVGRQDLNQVDPEVVLDSVTRVLENLQESDPRYAWMAVIEDKLLDGVLPRDRLLALAERFPGEQSLEGRLRQRAGQASARQWETESILRLRDCLEDQDPAPLTNYLAWMHDQLSEFWRDYEPTESDASPLELEKVAAQLLREAYQNWQTALQSVGTGDFEGGLALAIQANRLLVALHELDERPV
jgi:hypothetical protein